MKFTNNQQGYYVVEKHKEHKDTKRKPREHGAETVHDSHASKRHFSATGEDCGIKAAQNCSFTYVDKQNNGKILF